MEKEPLILFLCTPSPNMCGLQKKPKYMYEKLPSKETYIREKRPTKETYIYIWKETYTWRETYIFGNVPTE